MLRSIYIRINHLRIKEKSLSIISNNCIGASIAGSCKLRYNSPTVNLQVMPEDYSLFCKNLKEIIECDTLKEVKKFNQEQLAKISRLYNGRTPEQLGFPFGEIGGVLIAFQHYKTFDEAYECWERRKKRVFTAKKIKYVFIVDDRYAKEAQDFDKLDLPGSILLTNNFSYQAQNVLSKRVDTPEGVHFMATCGRVKLYYEKSFDVIRFINS